MKKSNIGLICVIVVIDIIAIMMISGYNGMVSKQENVESALSDLDVILQRRADLIPNLIWFVSGMSMFFGRKGHGRGGGGNSRSF